MRNLLLAAAAALALAAGSAQAAVSGPAWSFTSVNINFNNNDWNFANNFEVLNPVTVTGLGYYADPGTGAVNTNPVSLFACDAPGCNTTGTLLASAIVDNTYPLTNLFRFVTIPALNILPGFYQVAGISRGDNYTWNTNGFQTNPDIRYITNTWQLASGATNPFFLDFVRADQIDGYWGPNLFLGQPTFTGVPVPGALALFGVGLLGLAGLRRRG